MWNTGKNILYTYSFIGILSIQNEQVARDERNVAILCSYDVELEGVVTCFTLDV